jgi:hypothetical protein
MCKRKGPVLMLAGMASNNEEATGPLNYQSDPTLFYSKYQIAMGHNTKL